MRRKWKSNGRTADKAAAWHPTEAQVASEEISCETQQRIALLKRERERTEGEIHAEKARTRRRQAQALLCEGTQLSGLPPKAAALLREARS